jgi:ketosteroid isomerase-like protein
MDRMLTLIALAIAFAGVGCASTDHIEQDRKALLERDRAWSQSPPNVDQMVSFFAPDGSFLPTYMPAATGADAIRKSAAQIFAYPGFTLHWTATKADVAASGDLGYTQGTYQVSFQGPGGAPMSENGKYVTVWKKLDKQWWVVADIFNPDMPPPAPQAPAQPAQAR